MIRSLRMTAPLAFALIWGCDGPTSPRLEQSFEFDLTRAAGVEGWSAGFADYPAGAGESMGLTSGHEPLPAGLPREGNGLYSAGTNHSDDLFMFWKRRVSGLRPLTRYRVQFMVEFATRAPSECVGTGGAPGESVFLKAGASSLEPAAVLEQEGGTTVLRMNVDKGNQSEGGDDALVLGNIAGIGQDCDDAPWEIRSLESEGELETTSLSDGALWLLIGTDSGFEGFTEVYFTRMRARLRPV